MKVGTACLLLSLGAGRLLMSSLSGYIHPDEYFQGAEVLGSELLGAPGLRVWEFTTDKPIRSILAPYWTRRPSSPSFTLSMLP
jgi:phosphatidylinositol glycan class Z